ncbi:HAD hydrolase-like protein, partial [Streptomyces goshikiensis]
MTVPAPIALPAPAASESKVGERRHADRAQRALLLDLDGVLLDTRPVMQKAWRKVQEDHGTTLPFTDYERHLGREFSDIMQRLGIADIDAVRRTYETESVAAAHLAHEFTGIVEVLHAFVAADWRLGVVTSKHVDRAAPPPTPHGGPLAPRPPPPG